VEVVAPIPRGISHGTGIVLDATHVLTNAHVIEESRQASVNLPDGRTLGVQSIARDSLTDLAVVTVPLPAGVVRPAQLGDGKALKEGEYVVAVGYSPYFPSPPTNRIGTYGGRDPDVVDQLRTDMLILLGDSGG